MRMTVLTLAALLAGCIQAPSTPPAADDEAWYLGGAFTTERTEEDIEAVCLAGSGNRTCAIMESWPEQFGFRFDSRAACLDAHARIAQVPHVTVRACARVDDAGDDDDPVSVSPPPPPAREEDARSATYDVRTFEVTWSKGEGREHALEWEVVAAYRAGGVIVVNTTTHGIEGGDFRFRLLVRPDDDAGTVAFHAPGAAEPSTFDFTYSEEAYWSGRDIRQVDEVSPDSFVRIVHDDRFGFLEGTFRLDFTATCGADDCGDRGGPHRTILDGRFGK